jgi:hypothetical protein
MKPSILILSPYKTTTTTLDRTFKEKYYLNKFHHFREVKSIEQFTHIFILHRKLFDLYTAAYFQDIDVQRYDYYYGTREEVLNASVDDLVNHFLKFDWKKYDYLNVNYHIKSIEDHFKIKLDFQPKKDCQIIKLLKSNVHIVIIRVEELNQVFNQVCRMTGLIEMKLKNENCSEDKWYSEKIKLFREELNRRNITFD